MSHGPAGLHEADVSVGDVAAAAFGKFALLESAGVADQTQLVSRVHGLLHCGSRYAPKRSVFGEQGGRNVHGSILSLTRYRNMGIVPRGFSDEIAKFMLYFGYGCYKKEPCG